MSKQRIRNKENYEKAIELEKNDELEDALKFLQKVTTADPLNELAWNRSMIILRKLKKADDEIKLIKSAIDSYKKASDANQKQWIQDNKKKAQLTKELAKTLGLLGKNGLPEIQTETIEKWETRLHLLSHRLANAKRKAEKKKKLAKPVVKTTKKSIKEVKTQHRQRKLKIKD